MLRCRKPLRIAYSQDEVVRLRVSNGMKRICKTYPSLLVPYLDRFLTEVVAIDQPSAKWTLAQLFGMLRKDMTDEQIEAAKNIMKENLTNGKDWIVLNQTMHTLAQWSKTDSELRHWLEPHLERLALDERKSVAGRAKKILSGMGL